VATDKGVRGVPELLTGADRRDQFRSAVAGSHTQELPDGHCPHNAVCRKAGVALEVQDPGRRVFAEDAVDAATVEAERAQSLLEVGHVVAAKHWLLSGEDPVAEPITGLNQGGPRLAAAGPVDSQPSSVLEGLDGRPGRRPEVGRRIFVGRQAESNQPPAQIDDGFTLGTLSEQGAVS
jgi:hypothetical protein